MKPQTIFRIAHRNLPFSQIGNGMLRDKNLSIVARGCLALLLTYPEDWQFNLKWLCDMAGIGRDQARNVVKEMETHGYCLRRQIRKSDGTLGYYDYAFTDQPGSIGPPEPEIQAPVSTGDWKPGTGKPAPVNQSPYKEKSIYKENHKDQRSLNFSADARKTEPAQLPRFVSEAALEKVRKIAPGWDRQALLRKYLDWPGSQNARNMDAAFLAWVPKFTKGQRPS